MAKVVVEKAEIVEIDKLSLASTTPVFRPEESAETSTLWIAKNPKIDFPSLSFQPHHSDRRLILQHIGHIASWGSSGITSSEIWHGVACWP